MEREQFRTVWRGYDRAEVDAFLARAEAGAVSATDMIEHAFPIVLRGYDTERVDAYLDELADRHHRDHGH